MKEFNIMRFYHKRAVSVIFILLYALFFGCSENGKSIVVTTSMLESAAREVLPVSRKIDIVRLLPPSSCPGHFDLSPQIIPTLRSAVMVVRHDYQDVLEQKMESIGAKNVSALKISTAGSPLIPLNYYEMVEQIGLLLSENYPGNIKEISRAETEVKHRIDTLTKTIRKHAEPWTGKPVIAAVNVKEFCEWLGFDVAGVIKRPEDTTPGDLEQLMKIKADMVVGNLQEGLQGAIFMGEKMKIPVAVLSNFPGADGYGLNYYQLMEENLKRLDAAWLML